MLPFFSELGGKSCGIYWNSLSSKPVYFIFIIPCWPCVVDRILGPITNYFFLFILYCLLIFHLFLSLFLFFCFVYVILSEVFSWKFWVIFSPMGSPCCNWLSQDCFKHFSSLCLVMFWVQCNILKFLWLNQNCAPCHDYLSCVTLSLHEGI